MRHATLSTLRMQDRPAVPGLLEETIVAKRSRDVDEPRFRVHSTAQAPQKSSASNGLLSSVVYNGAGSTGDPADIHLTA